MYEAINYLANSISQLWSSALDKAIDECNSEAVKNALASGDKITFTQIEKFIHAQEKQGKNKKNWIRLKRI